MKKLFSILMMVAAMTAFVACSEKDNGTDTPGGNNGGNTEITDLNGTSWLYTVGTNSQDGYVYVGVAFDMGMSTVNHTYCTGGEQTYEIYGGAYTYSAGSGSITLIDMSIQQNVGTATFSISGSTLTLNLLGETYTLAKQ